MGCFGGPQWRSKRPSGALWGRWLRRPAGRTFFAHPLSDFNENGGPRRAPKAPNWGQSGLTWRCKREGGPRSDPRGFARLPGWPWGALEGRGWGRRGAEAARRKTHACQIYVPAPFLFLFKINRKLIDLRGTGGVAGGLGFVQAQESFWCLQVRWLPGSLASWLACLLPRLPAGWEYVGGCAREDLVGVGGGCGRM